MNKAAFLLLAIIPGIATMSLFREQILSFYSKQIGLQTVQPELLDTSCSQLKCTKSFRIKKPARYSVGLYGAFAYSWNPELTNEPSALYNDWFKFKVYSSTSTSIVINTQYSQHSKKTGIEGSVFIGSQDKIEQARFLFSVLRVQFNFLLAGFTLLIALIIFIQHTDYTYSNRNNSTLLLTQLAFVIVSTLSSSHIFDGIAPFGSGLHQILSLIPRIFILPAIVSLVFSKHKQAFLFIGLHIFIYVFSAIPSIISEFVIYKFYPIEVFLTTIACVVSSIRKKAYGNLFFLTFMCWDSLVLIGALNLSTGTYATPLLLPSLFLQNYWSDLKLFIALRNFSGLIRKLRSKLSAVGTPKEHSIHVESLIKQAIIELSIALSCKVSFLILASEGPKVITARKGKTEDLPQWGHLPPVFAHVIQTASPMWWATADDIKKILPLKKQVTRLSYAGTLSCVVPLVVSGKSYGAISATDFSNERDLSNDGVREYTKSIIEAFIDSIGSTIVGNIESSSAESQKLSIEILDATVGNLLGVTNSEDAFAGFLKACKSIAGVEGIAYSLESDRRLVAVSDTFTNSKARSTWRSIPFRARLENRSSPFALAINDRKSMKISDVRSLFGILEDSTIQAIKEIGETAFLLLPVHLGSNTFGLLFLFQPAPTEFSSLEIDTFSPSLVPLSSKLSELEKTATLKDTENALSLMVDANEMDEVRKELAKGSRVIGQTSNFFIIVQDLRGSTDASNKFHATEWANKMHSIYSLVQELSDDAGGFVEKTVGDGIVTLIDASTSSKHLIGEMLQAYQTSVASKARESIGIEDTIMVGHYGEVFLGISGHKNRVSWDTLGAEMNNTFAIEKAAKKYEKRTGKKVGFAASDAFISNLTPDQARLLRDTTVFSEAIPHIAGNIHFFDSIPDFRREKKAS